MEYVSMGPSEKSFNQVKAILERLDRNIEALREKRTNKPPIHLAATEPVRPEPQVAPPPVVSQPRPGSAYGRAKPLPPSGN